METRVTKNASETQKLGEEIAENVKNGGILCLYGDLGSGKTTFVQGLAKGLGISHRIISPTFVIIRTYRLPEEKSFYHIDLYRVEGEEGLGGLGMKDILGDSKNIVVIEWPEKLGNLLPEKRIDINFNYESDDIRKIGINMRPS